MNQPSSQPSSPATYGTSSVAVGHRLRHWTRWLLLTLMVGSLLPLVAQTPLALAAGVTVTTTTDEDNGSLGGGTGISLREAVLYAATNDVINLPAGTYTLTIPGGANDTKKGDIDVSGKALTITGAGAATTKILADFPKTGTNARDRVLDVLPGATLTLSGVTISGGITSTTGGGIRNQGTLNASNIVVSGNYSVLVNDTVVEGNNGGGITNTNGATATIIRSEIKGNTANRNGGGIFNDVGSTLILDRTTVANNVTTKENGGGIDNEGTVTITNSTFSGNSSNRSGGGIYNNGTASVTNSTITDNICNADTRIGGDGGGAYNNASAVGSLTFQNTIIAGNQDRPNPPTPNTFASVFPDLNAQTPNTIVGNSNNLISSRAGINNSTTIGTPGQSDIVSADIGLAKLANNGGATLTHVLLPTSPAIDAARNNVCAAAPVNNLDQRDQPRPADGNADSEVVCDIGAVEVRAALVLLDDTLAIPNGGSLSFGSTPRDTPLTKVLTIRNSGEATLVLDAASVPAGFTLVEGFASTRIAPGEETTLTLQFNATTLGDTSGQFTFGTNDPGANPFQVTLIGTATAKPATLAVADGSTNLPSNTLVNFGSTASGTSVDKTFTITNVGDENLTLGVITLPTGFAIQSAPSTTPLAPNATTSFTVRLSATTPGVPAGMLSIASNAGSNNPFLLRLKGIVSGSTTDQLFVLDNTNVSEVTNGGSVTFGSTVVGTPLVRIFTLANIGNGPLTINPLAITPPGSGFSLVGSFSTTTLAKGGSVDVQIQADATSAGASSGTALFNNTDTNENPFSFTLNATVGASPAKIVVTEGATTITDNTGRSNFGNTVIGMPVVKTFTISNTGGNDLALISPTVPAGFEIVSPFTSPVAPGASTTMQVRLRATTVGTFSGVLSFGTNDPTANPFNFTVSGIVTNPPAQIVVSIASTTVISGSSVDLGVTQLGSPARKVFTITNTGGSLLLLDSINVPPGFTRDPDVTTADTLAPGASTTFVIVLDADTAGMFDGRVTIRSNDPAAVDFGFTIVGTVGPRGVYLPLIRK